MEAAIVDLEKEEEVELALKANILIDIFPDADPLFVRQKCEEYLWQNDVFQAFINSLIERKDYPKKRVDETPLQEESSHKPPSTFSCKNFLDLIPDPWKFFTESNNGKHYKELTLHYLKDRFRFASVDTITKVLKNNNFNLTISKKVLDKGKNTRKTRRGNSELKMTEPLLQNKDFLLEVDFLEHEEEIVSYKNSIELHRHEAKLKGEIFTCGCCWDDECLLDDAITCEEGHLFCKNCVKRSSEVILGEGKVEFPCLTSCPSAFSVGSLNRALPKNMVEKLLKRRQELEVKAAGIDGLESCPFCEFAVIPPEGDRIFRCQSCLKESCRQCKKLNHIPLRCDEAIEKEKTKSRIFIEDRMTEALVRVCYRCNNKFIKADGCNKMTCTCGAKMCYLCRKPVRDYNHFAENKDNSGKCPLYSNNEDLHINAVVKAGEEAKNEVLQNNAGGVDDYNPFIGLEKTVKMPKNNTGNLNRGERNMNIRGIVRNNRRRGNIVHQRHNHQRILDHPGYLAMLELVRIGRNPYAAARNVRGRNIQQ